MTATLISLLSVLSGIFGANLIGVVSKRFSFDLVGNTIAGVFGGVLLIKSIGRLGFDPASIVASGSSNYLLLTINLLISFVGGVFAVIAMTIFKNRMGRSV